MLVRKIGVLAVLTGLTLAASACSSGSGSGGSGSSSKVVTIMGILDLSGTNGAYTQFENAMTASVAGANARHEVGNNVLKIVFCDSAANANATAACGQKAVSDHVAGVVTLAGNATYEPYLLQAGIPTVDILLNPVMYTSKISFSIFGGGVANSSGFASGAKALGCKKVVLVAALGEPANVVAQAAAAFAKTAKGAGVQVGPAVSAPAGTPDMSPFIAKALNSNPDCLVLQGYAADGIALIKATLASGKNVKILTGASYYTPQGLNSLGSQVAQVDFVTVGLPSTSSNPTVKEWVSDINKYSPSPKSYEGGSAALWADVQLLAYASGHISGTVDASSMLKYLDNVKFYNPGLLPAVNFTKAPANPAGPRVFAPYALLVQYHNGVWDTIGDGSFYNVFTGAKVPLTPTTGSSS
jgi:ABC-type branched-subunit amino acid transport system substrate-binding protein